MNEIFEIIKDKKLFSGVLENIHNGIVLIDRNKKVLYINNYLKSVFDIEKKSYLDNFADLIIGNFLSCEHDCTNCKGCQLDTDIKNMVSGNCCQRKVNECFQFINKIGKVKYFKYSIIPINNDDQLQFFITFDDITEEKRLYKELELKHFRLKMLSESLENSDSIVMAVANSVEAKDKLTKGHISRVAYFAEHIGRYFNMTEKELETLKKGAVLHDIGKIGTPDYILNKPGPLNDEEFEVMKQHPIDGWKILKSMKSFENIAKIVRHHHEKLDGSGYPDGICGKEIDIYTRIVAIVDIYDALIAQRPYRNPLTREQALEIIFKDVQSGKLDKEVAEALSQITFKISFNFDK